MRAIRFLAVAGLAILPCLPAFAADSTGDEETVTWYDVEMIVFRNLETRSTEKWPPDAGVPDVENARPLFPAESKIDPETGEPVVEENAVQAQPFDALEQPQAPTPYKPLDESAMQLNGVMSSLQRSSIYEPILHVAWAQPPLERSEAPYIRITLPGALDPEMPADETAPADEWQETESFGNANPLSGSGEEQPLLGSTDRPTSEEFSVEELPEGAEQFLQEEDEPEFARPLDGVVQLSVSRYLHLDLDLLYLPEDLNTTVLDDIPVATREWTEEDRRAREERRRNIVEALARGDISLEEAEILSLEPEQQVFEGFRLDQFRRLRSRELHYFDHPVFGVLVMVTPHEVPVSALNAEAASSR